MDDIKNVKANQFRATKLWNDVVNEFRISMRPTRHRRQFRVYEDCFTGSDAADWMHKHLRNNPNFGSGVTRDKSVLLLQKFVNAGIIEDAKGKRRAFSDGKRLFKFVQGSNCENQAFQSFETGNSELSKPASPLKPTVSVRHLERNADKLIMDPDLSEVWKNVVLGRIRRLSFDGESIDSILAYIECSADDICHNLYNLSKNGVVILRNKSDDLPPYVIHAMKCLIKWPNLNGLLDYPGFQVDVLKVVNDFFDCQSLLPEPIYRLFMAIFQRQLRMKERFCRAQPQVPSVANILRPLQTEVSGESIEELMNDLTMQTVNPFDKMSPIASPPPDYHYETAFVTATPCTRIIPRAATQISLQAPHSCILPNKTANLMMPPPPQPKVAFVKPTCQMLKRSPSPWERRSVTSVASSTSTKSSGSSIVNGYVNLAFGSSSSICTTRSTASGTPAMPVRRLQPVTCYSYRSLQDCAQQPLGISNLPRTRRSLDLPRLADHNEEDMIKEQVCASLQTASLLLAPIKRRYLHLLLRFIYKTARNEELVLQSGKSNIDVLLDTFVDCVCPYWTADTECREMLRFLSDYCDTVFAVPDGLKTEIEARLNILRGVKLQKTTQVQTPSTDKENSTPDVAKPIVSYCKVISTEQYRDQAKECSTKALCDLLDCLLEKTENTSDPEQLRRLKLFEECYPLICAKRKADIDKRLGRRPSASNVRRSTSFSFDHKLINSIRL